MHAVNSIRFPFVTTKTATSMQIKEILPKIQFRFFINEISESRSVNKINIKSNEVGNG